MGNSQQKLENYITNSVTYSQVISSTLNLKNASDTNVIGVQSFKIQNGGSQMCCCQTATAEGDCTSFYPSSECTPAKIDCPNISVGQTVTNDIKIVQQIDSQFTQQLAAQLQNTAQADVANALDQLQKVDPTTWQSISQDSINDVKNEIDQRINVDNVSNIVNNVITNLYNAQTQTINNCGVITGDACDFSQNIANTVTVQNILTSLANQFSDATATNDLYNKVQTSMSQTQEGALATVSDAISNFFSSLGEFALAFLIGGGIFVFILIIVFVFIFFRGGGKEALQKVTERYIQTIPVPAQQPLPQ